MGIKRIEVKNPLKQIFGTDYIYQRYQFNKPSVVQMIRKRTIITAEDLIYNQRFLIFLIILTVGLGIAGLFLPSLGGVTTAIDDFCNTTTFTPDKRCDDGWSQREWDVCKFQYTKWVPLHLPLWNCK